MDLLGRARGFFKGISTPAVARVQYYNVVCPQGHRVRGQRNEGYQALRCPACGEGVFVLPVSPLPEPEPPPRSAARRTGVRRPIDDDAPLELKDPGKVTVEVADPNDRAAEAEIEWEDEAAAESQAVEPAPAVEEPKRPRPIESRGKPGPETPGRSEKPRTRAAPRRAARDEAAHDESPDVLTEAEAAPVRPAPRRLSRPALVIAALILLAAGSITLRTWRARRHRLPEVAAVGRTEGIPALEEGKFDKAYQLLARARDAVDTLGDDVEGAEEIRHAADEASVFVDLLSDSLETLLEEAARARPQEWETRFKDLYKGRSVIIQATVVETPADGGSGRYELDYVVLPPGDGAGETRFARVDISDLEALTLAQPKVGDQVIFGARLASFQYDTDRETFVIRFEPKSGVAIRYHKALEALGWPSGARGLDERSEGGSEP